MSGRGELFCGAGNVRESSLAICASFQHSMQEDRVCILMYVMTGNRTHPLVPDSKVTAAVAISAREADRLLASDPGAAEAWAHNFLIEHPANQGALLLLAVALRAQRKFAEAKDVLTPLTQAHPELVRAHFELGLVFAELGQHRESIIALSSAVDLMPNFPDAWYALIDQVRLLEREQPRGTSPAWLSKCDEQLAQARDFLRAGRQAEAEALLLECLEAQPDFEFARFLLAVVLLAQEKGRLALPHIEKLLADDPDNSLYRDLRAAALFQIGKFGEAIAEYEQILKNSPDRPGAWMSLGRALRALGRQNECVVAFKKAIELLPGWIEARRTLASVKTHTFEPAEIAAIRDLLARAGLPATSYAELHFALGRALEDAGQYAESFDNYQKSQAIQKANTPYSVEATARYIQRIKAQFTDAFFRERAHAGCQSAAPIFIVGMPRAGSTLVQEILCAHSAIERTGELRHLTWMTARLDREKTGTGMTARYPEIVRSFAREQFRLMGEEYLQRSLLHRRLGRPFFVDKYPGNFLHAGLIHLILPGAKIIDMRRHPLDCCLSCFKNYFPEGPPFSHSLSDLGHYYADYVELMAHFDDVLPGKIHRIIYEKLIEAPEKEARRLFEYLNLPFEEQCLRFYEREQAIMTTSSEQARTPINKSGMGAWQNYESFIGPLKSALGPVLGNYPAAPKFYRPIQISTTIRLA